MKTKAFKPQDYNVDVKPNWFNEIQRIYQRHKLKHYRGSGYNFHTRKHKSSSKERINTYLHYMIYHAPHTVKLRWSSAQIQQKRKERTVWEYKVQKEV
jgi:hypothetical protein